MNLLLITTIISATANLILGVFVLVKKYQNNTSRLFGLFCLFVAAWSVLTYYGIILTDKESLLIIMRWVMAFAVVQSVTILLFVITLLNKKFKIGKWIVVTILLLGIATFILCLTPFMFSDNKFVDDGVTQLPVVAPGILLFVIVTIGSIFSSIFLLFKGYFKSAGILRVQLGFILSGTVLMYLGVLYFSFFQVILFENSNYVYLSSLFTLPFVFFTSYSILRHRFMDIRVIVRKSIIYVFSLIIALGIFTYVVLAFKNKIEESWNLNTTLTTVILIILVAVGFPPLKNLVEKLVNKIFKDKKSIDLAVAEVKEKLSHETDFDNLIHIVKKEIKEYLQIENVQLFVLDKVNHNFKGKDSEVGKSIPQKSELIKYFEKYNDVLITEEIPHLQNERTGKFEVEMLQQADKEIKKYNFRLAMPIVADREIIAVLGFSGTGKSFTVQDVDYLNKLREQIAFAIANALLYKEAIDRIKK